MNNTIEFVVRMKNLMGGELGKLSSVSQTSFGKMSKHVDQVTGRNKVLNSSFSELSKRISETENNIKSSTIPSQIAFARRELAALQRQANNHPGNMGGGSGSNGSSGIGIGGVAIGGMLANAGSRILGMVTDGLGAVIQQSFDKEQAITGLTTFLGKQGANDAYKNIRQDANVTPFDTASLLQVNRALISAGENATNARKTSMDLANAVSAVGGGNDELSRMAANMQQIKTVGKATAMDIRQFGIAGINIYEMLSKSTGKNINQVKEMDVTYEQLQKALAMSRGKGGMYEGAMAAQSQTKSGKWATMKDNFMTAAADVGDAFSPVLNKLLDLGIRIANTIGPTLVMAKPYIDAISNGLNSVIEAFTQIGTSTGGWSDWLAIAKEHVSGVWKFIKDIGIKLWNLVASIMEFVKNSKILKDVFRFIGWIFEKLYGLISWLLSGVIWLWENIIKPILTAIDSVYKWIKGDDGKELKVTAVRKTVGPKKPQDSLFQNSKMAASNDASGKAAGESVVGGGPKTININVGKFFDNINFTTMSGSETAEELEKIVLECLARVIANGSKLI